MSSMGYKKKNFKLVWDSKKNVESFATSGFSSSMIDQIDVLIEQLQ